MNLVFKVNKYTRTKKNVLHYAFAFGVFSWFSRCPEWNSSVISSYFNDVLDHKNREFGIIAMFIHKLGCRTVSFTLGNYEHIAPWPVPTFKWSHVLQKELLFSDCVLYTQCCNICAVLKESCFASKSQFGGGVVCPLCCWCTKEILHVLICLYN